jgi:hypothetical protein
VFGEDRFYIVSPIDILLAQKRDVADHIDWLLQRKDFEVLEQAWISYQCVGCTCSTTRIFDIEAHACMAVYCKYIIFEFYFLGSDDLC